MQPLISIIVPIYNVEQYLRQCVDSLLAQTYTNLEIILVDDGSPDNCPAICDEYAQQDSRIRVIHKENGGLSDARNAGIAVAKGEYIGFVDSDDWVAPDMYEYLYNGAQEYDSEITLCELYECGPEKYTATRRQEVRIFEGEEAMEALILLKFGSYAWNKLYKRELWDSGIRYPKGKLYEDVLTTYRLVEKCERVACLPEPKIFYRQTNTSISGTHTIKNDVQAVTSRIERFYALNQYHDKHLRFMLKDLFRFVPGVRTAIFNGTEAEFNQYYPQIQMVSDFLRRYASDLAYACGFDAYGKQSCELMGKGTREGWLEAYTVDVKGQKQKGKKKFSLKQEIDKLKAKIEEFKRKFRANEKKRYYYNICGRMPLNENAALVDSRAGEDLAGNMFEVAQELCARGIKVYLTVKPNSMRKVKNILATGSFPGLEIVEKWSKPYYKALATSKYLFNDMVFEPLIVKRPGQVYTNTWHGTPLKALEFDVKEQRHNLGGATRDFLKCDYLAVPSRFLFKKLLTSAHVDTIFRGKALYSGYPRNSVFFDEEKRSYVREALKLQDKEVFVYMPTWRGNQLEHTGVEGEYASEQILDFFENTLQDNQVMLVKMHNYAVGNVDFSNYTKVRPFPKRFESYSVLNIADCLITDYSSVFFDYANTRGKVILFTYDREQYLKERGLYLDLDELPFPKANNYEELAAHLNIQKDYDDAEFIEKYCTYDCADSVKKLVDHVLGIEEACKTQGYRKNKKKNILIYDSRYKYREGRDPNVEKALKKLKLDKANYFYCYPQGARKKAPYYLRKMNRKIHLFALTDKPITFWHERLLMILLHKKTLRSQVLREANRQAYGFVFDEVRVIGKSKRNQFAHILSHPDFKKRKKK